MAELACQVRRGRWPRTTPTATCAMQGEALPAHQRPSMTTGWVVYLLQLLQATSPPACAWAAGGGQRKCCIRKMTIGKQSTDVHSPSCSCRPSSTPYLRKGLMDPPRPKRHLRRLQKAAGTPCWRASSPCPRRHAPHRSPEGGLFVLAELPEGMDAKALLDKCRGKQRRLRARHASSTWTAAIENTHAPELQQLQRPADSRGHRQAARALRRPSGLTAPLGPE